MMLRALLPALLLLPVLAPSEARACSPDYGFTIEATYPREGEFEVPTDGVVVVTGENEGAPVTIEVRLAGALVEGATRGDIGPRFVWRASAPLQPNTEYAVHVETEGDAGPDVRDYVFTTGAGPAPELTAPQSIGASAEGFEREVRECVLEADPGSCGACEAWEVVAVESRMRLNVSVPSAGGPFQGHLGSVIHFGKFASALDQSSVSEFQRGADGSLHHAIDLGLAGSWDGDQVCVQAEVFDPLDRSALGPVECVDIGELNVVPDADSEGDESSGGGDESSGELYEGPGQDIEIGCDVRGPGAPLWPGALLLIGVGLLRRRR